MTAALAIFARTPRRSAAKTRLAEQTSRRAAEELYELSLRCAAETGRQLQADGWQVGWAVAEATGAEDDYWRHTGLAAARSGRGGLGSRLASTYARLLGQAKVAVMIGSDSPQLSAGRLRQAARLAGQRDFVAGPAEDGGFYVFAGSRPLAPAVWESVSYSRPDTLEQLCRAVGGDVAMLGCEADFDDLDSLAAVVAAMPERPSAVQQAFCDRAARLIGE